MIEHGLLFTGPMVRALLDGLKTQTRRIGERYDKWKPGELIWVRETWAIKDCGPRVSLSPEAWPHGWPIKRLEYLAGWSEDAYVWNKRASLYMPRWASRITLEIVNIRVERLQEISERDAKAEGVEPEFEMNASDFISGKKLSESTYRLGYKHCWDSINAGREYGWDANPWVWVITFKRVR